jgi:hypothetical protein
MGGGGGGGQKSLPALSAIALGHVGGKKFEKLGGKISECPDSGPHVTLLEFLLSLSDITSKTWIVYF